MKEHLKILTKKPKNMTKKIILILLIFNCFTGFSQKDTLSNKIVVGIKQTPPFIYKENDKIKGLSIDLWEKLAPQLGLEYEYKEYKLKDLLVALENGEVDMCISPLTVTSERIKKFNFLQPFYDSNLAITTHKQDSNSLFLFLKNFFSYDFFKAVSLMFFIILIFGILLWIVEKRNNPEQFGKGIKGMGQGIWWSAVTMTTVGYGDKAPSTPLGRVIATVWMFTAVIIISGFTGSISSALTVNKLQSNIQSVNDLKRLDVGTVEGSSSYKYLIKKDINASTFTTVKNGLQALYKNEIDAFVYDEPIMKHHIFNNNFDDKLYILPIKFNTQYYSFSLPANNIDQKKLNYLLLKELESSDWQNILANYKLK